MACTHASFTPGCPDCGDASTALRPTGDDESQPPTVRSREPREPLPLDPTVISSRLHRGALVGRYVVLDTLGQGGMGSVYAAFDPELDRKVAVKLLRPEVSQSQDDGRSRLLREAQAMARLSHPNVVPVHDVGLHGGGVFIAMEHVQGQTLHSWSREKPRAWREALGVLIAAGRGLSAAHAAGLIHRDFKPANVLVGDDGRVRVTDFGLVRAMDGVAAAPELPPSLQDDSLRRGGAPSLDTQLTEVGTVMGTPGYMAPEQLTDEPVTPRTDQFAFCASCYQVLYGELPFPGKTLNEYSAAVMVGTVRPPPAGSKVPGWVRQLLLRGLSVHPKDRFPSMDALLEALGRDPALARRRWLLAGGLGAAALAGVAAVMLGGGTRGQLCSGAPLKLVGVWDDAAKAQGEKAFKATGRPFASVAWEQASRELNRYASAWSTMHREACEATRVRGEQPDSVLALRMTCLDERLRALGAVARTFGNADDKAVEKAVDAATALPRLDTCADVAALARPVPPPADEAGRAKLEAARQKLAEARALSETGKNKEAMVLVTSITSLGPDVGFRQTEAAALLLKSVLLKNLGLQAEQAEEALMAAVAAAEEARDDELRARALASLVGTLGYDRGLQKEGYRLAKLADGAITRTGGDELRRADLASHLGDVEWRAGAFEAAVGKYQEALALRRRHTADDRQVGYLLYSIGWTLMDLGDLDRAAEHLGQASRIYERLYGEEHPKTLTVMNARAVLAARREDLPQAHALFERVLRINERAYGTEHPNYAALLGNLATVLIAEGKADEALKVVQQATRIREERRGKNSPEYAESQIQLASALSAVNRHDEALRITQHALEQLERNQPDNEAVTQALEVMSLALGALGRHDEAIDAAKRAHARENKPGAGMAVARSLRTLARTYREAGRHRNAVEFANRLVELREDARSSAVDLAEARFELAQALWGIKKERPRARQLGTEAREAYAAAGRERRAEQVDRWLQARH